MESQHIAKLKKLTGRQRGNLTRLRNQALAIIEGSGSNTRLLDLIEESEKTLRSLIEVSDEYLSLVDGAEKDNAEQYMQEEEAKHIETVIQIRDYLRDRQGEATPITAASAADHGSEAAADFSDPVRPSDSKEAEIQAKLKELRLHQLERQLAEQRKEQELASKRKLQEARDDAQLARLEAEWRKQADNGLPMNCPNDSPEARSSAAVSDLGKGKVRSDLMIDSLQECQQGTTPDAGEMHADGAMRYDRGARSDVGDRGSPSGYHAARGAHLSCDMLSKSIPRLTLPSFDGNPLEWPRWFSLFKCLIHNQLGLSNTEKMIHLQSAVQGSAKQAISGLIFDPDLYPQAIDVLKARFGREQDIVQSHLESMLSAPPPVLSNAASMEQFCGVVNSTVTVLQKLDFLGDLESYENLRRMVERLPKELRREWGKHVVETEMKRPTLIHFNAWVEKQLEIVLSCSPKGQPVRRTTLVTNTFNKICPCCAEQHEIQTCELYQQKTPDERLRFLAENRMCFGCLRKNHLARDCRTTTPCGIDGCRFKHHESLHGAHANRETSSHQSGNQHADASRRTLATAAPARTRGITLLQIVPIRVHGVKGRFRDTYGLLDPGSETSLISENLMNYLGLTGPERTLRIDNVEGTGAPQSSKQVTFDVSSRTSAGTRTSIRVPEAFVIPRINVTVPRIPEGQRTSWTHLEGLDIPRCDGADVEVLIGANVVEAVLYNDVRVGQSGQPVALRTAFGWTLTGSVSGLPGSSRRVMFVAAENTSKDDESNLLLQRWWTTEAFGTKFNFNQPISQEDKRSINIMETSTRKIDIRYETGLLWKSEDVALPNNKIMALRRLESLERSLLRQPEKATLYQSVLDRYIKMGHARKLEQNEREITSLKTWYLPHHAVTNSHKPGKLRVVFDAAAQFAGVSLNNQLLTGPDLLRNLTVVLLRFRRQDIAIAADIEEMYHQVKVPTRDQGALRFLWRDLDTRREPDVYQMTVTIFGAKCSPASANYVLRRTG